MEEEKIKLIIANTLYPLDKGAMKYVESDLKSDEHVYNMKDIIDCVKAALAYKSD